MSLARPLARGLWSEMPVLRVGIGLCPALAVSRTLKNGVGMAFATAVVLVASRLLIPVVDRAVPGRMRFICRMAVIAGLVTGVDLLMTRYAPELRAELSIFVPLIAVNCMVIGGMDGGSGQGRAAVVLGGLGRGLGFAMALALLSALREAVGTGAVWGHRVLGETFNPVSVAALPPGAFIAAGLLAGLVGLVGSRRIGRA